MALVIATLLFAGSSFIGMQNAYAVPVPIADHSFESQVLADEAFTLGGPDTFWEFDPTTGYFNPGPDNLTPEAFDGEDVAFGGDPGEICQELGPITGNTLYALSVYVAERKDTSFGGYDIELRDASDESVLASVDETTGNRPAIDTWAENTLLLTIPDVHPSIDNNLKICLSSNEGQALFDLVTLDAIEPPEEGPFGVDVDVFDKNGQPVDDVQCIAGGNTGIVIFMKGKTSLELTVDGAGAGPVDKPGKAKSLSVSFGREDGLISSMTWMDGKGQAVGMITVPSGANDFHVVAKKIVSVITNCKPPLDISGSGITTVDVSSIDFG